MVLLDGRSRVDTTKPGDIGVLDKDKDSTPTKLELLKTARGSLLCANTPKGVSIGSPRALVTVRFLEPKPSITQGLILPLHQWRYLVSNPGREYIGSPLEKDDTAFENIAQASPQFASAVLKERTLGARGGTCTLALGLKACVAVRKLVDELKMQEDLGGLVLSTGRLSVSPVRDPQYVSDIFLVSSGLSVQLFERADGPTADRDDAQERDPLCDG